MKKIYSIILVGLVFAGCNFLDKEPDMRASINTKEKVQLLLTSAYTQANTGAILEFSSDNIIDGNAPDAVGHQRNLGALDKMYDEIFAWQPVTTSGEQDSPKYIWDACYMAIAAANQALQAIEKLEAEGEDMSAEKGEALLCRAYHHFLLANVFCQTYKNPKDSKKDLGLVYMLEPETEVAPHYERESLYDTYENIEKDLEEGLKLVTDNYYLVPKYHFNIKAAHAFAARFYLYKREWAKVIQHANVVLGTTHESARPLLFNNTAAKIDATNLSTEIYLWWDASSPANLLLYTTMSQAPYAFFVPSYNRYQCSGSALDYTYGGAGPCWSDRRLYSSVSLWSYGSENYGSFIAKAYYLFEYTDKVNGYGYIHGVTRAFTTNETLLCRAEAKAQTNDLTGALTDLRTWIDSYNVAGNLSINATDSITELTAAQINGFYNGSNLGTPYAPELNNEKIDPQWVISDEQRPYIYCALHFRRLETLHDGLRWADLKRYGIEIEHKQGILPVKKMAWNDDRWAIQLPQEVILSGLTGNPRQNIGDNISTDYTAGVPDHSDELQPNATIGMTAVVTKENND